MPAVNVRKRTVVPKATTKAEVPVTPAPVKASIWVRAKATVVKTAKRVATFVKTTARKVASVSTASAKRVLPVARRAWTVAMRPFLRGIGAGIAFGGLLVSTIIAPIVTIALLLGASAFIILLAKGVQRLEAHQTTSRTARVLLRALDIVGHIFQVMFYTVAALFAAAMCAVSWPFAVFTGLILVLAYYDVRGAGTIAFLVWCTLSGAWALGLLWILWRGLGNLGRERVTVPEYSEIRRTPEGFQDIVTRPAAKPVAKGTEEVADLQEWSETWQNDVACAACGTHAGALRTRSNALPFVTTGTGAGKPLQPSTDMLCTECYDAECEDIAIALTGVSLKKRSANITLNAMGRATLEEVAASREDVTKVFWAVTAWWRDRRGAHHERQWDCFHDGKVVATVVYDHAYKVYRATALGKFLGTKTAAGAAQRLATDILFDEANAVTRMVEALADDAESVVRESVLKPA